MNYFEFEYKLAALQGKRAALNSVIIAVQEELAKIDRQIAILCDNTKEATHDESNRDHAADQ